MNRVKKKTKATHIKLSHFKLDWKNIGQAFIRDRKQKLKILCLYLGSLALREHDPQARVTGGNYIQNVCGPLKVPGTGAQEMGTNKSERSSGSPVPILSSGAVAASCWDIILSWMVLTVNTKLASAQHWHSGPAA